MSVRAGEVMLRREDDGRVVCERCVIADTLPRRLRGLLGVRGLPAGEGIVLRPGWSIHTAFMRFPIDVVYVDANQVVMKVVPNLKPWRASTCRGARDVVELAAGECARRGLQAGDRVTWAARPLNGDAPARSSPAGAPDRHELEGNGDGAGPERPIRVLLGTRDDRFLRLARFLLTRNDFVVESTKRLPTAVEYVERHGTDVVVLDASDSLSEAAKTVAAIEALNPEVRVLLVSDADRPRPTAGLNVMEKWQALESLPDEIKLSHAGSRAWN
jgi:uncharacterized membrane protein (UPF0127 family)